MMRMNILMTFWQKYQKLCSFYLVFPQYILLYILSYNHICINKYSLNIDSFYLRYTMEYFVFLVYLRYKK